jgi:hypothetical protein
VALFTYIGGETHAYPFSHDLLQKIATGMATIHQSTHFENIENTGNPSTKPRRASGVIFYANQYI